MAEAEKKVTEEKDTGGKAGAPEAKASAQGADAEKKEPAKSAAKKTGADTPKAKAAKTGKKPASGKARKKAASKSSAGIGRSSKPKAKARTAKAGARRTARRVEKTVKTATTFKDVENIMTKATYNFDRLTQDAQNTGKEGVEAFVQSGSIFARGFEDILKTYVNLAQESAERNSQAVKTLLGSRTLNEFTEAQSRLARENFDDFLNGVTKISELSVKVTTEALEPINDQFSKTVRKVSESAAA